MIVHPADPIRRRLVDVLSDALEILASSSQAARCAQEAERPFALSDEELARRGLTRDGIVRHAFARYMAC